MQQAGGPAWRRGAAHPARARATPRTHPAESASPASTPVGTPRPDTPSSAPAFRLPGPQHTQSGTSGGQGGSAQAGGPRGGGGQHTRLAPGPSHAHIQRNHFARNLAPMAHPSGPRQAALQPLFPVASVPGGATRARLARLARKVHKAAEVSGYPPPTAHTRHRTDLRLLGTTQAPR